MPHIVLEYSSNLARAIDFRRILDDLHDMLGAVESFEEDRIKSRAMAYDVFRAGQEPDRGFVHVAISFSPGRDGPLRKAIGERILNKLLTDVAPPTGGKVSRSVEIRQFEAAMYFNDYGLQES